MYTMHQFNTESYRPMYRREIVNMHKEMDNNSSIAINVKSMFKKTKITIVVSCACLKVYFTNVK